MVLCHISNNNQDVIGVTTLEGVKETTLELINLFVLVQQPSQKM